MAAVRACLVGFVWTLLGIGLLVIAVVVIVCERIASWFTRAPAPLPAVTEVTPTRSTELKAAAVLARCPWCDANTIHVRRGRGWQCRDIGSHWDTENYRKLAACLPNADLFPGCICFPGEYTLFEGKPDPFCFATGHRP